MVVVVVVVVVAAAAAVVVMVATAYSDLRPVGLRFLVGGRARSGGRLRQEYVSFSSGSLRQAIVRFSSDLVESPLPEPSGPTEGGFSCDQSIEEGGAAGGRLEPEMNGRRVGLPLCATPAGVVAEVQRRHRHPSRALPRPPARW